MSVYNTTSLRPRTRSKIIDRDYMAHVARWSYAVRLIEQRPRQGRTPVVIDLGCGVDAPLLEVISRHAFLARGGIRYYGIDVGPIRVDSVPGWAQLYPRTDATSWVPPEPGTVVVCFETIEHMPKDRGLVLLDVIARSTRPTDGVALLSTPVRDPRTLPRNHVYEWDRDELIEAAQSAGLTTEAQFGTFMDVQTARACATAAPALQHAWRLFEAYYSNEALSALFAPLFPESAKSIMLVLRRSPNHV